MTPMSLSFTDRVVMPRGVVARAVGRSTVLLNSQSGRYFTLDEIGTRTWTLLTSSASIQAAYDTLMSEFTAEPDQLADDLEALLGRLNSLGLIEIQRG
jgi:hypothetical protein